MDVLKACLLDLSHDFDQAKLPLLVGGGYGLFLKQIERAGETEPTIIEQRFWPVARTTNDIDMFVSTEVIVSGEKFAQVRAILDRLGYRIPDNETARNWQFVKQNSVTAGGLAVKVDLLTGPIPDEKRQLIKSHSSDSFNRVRPREGLTEENNTHALETKEALHFESGALPITVSGKMTDGQEHRGTILIPSPFTYLLMKLKAYEDRRGDDRRQEHGKNHAMHHAGDIYRIVATMTPSEYENCRELIASDALDQSVLDTTKIAKAYFSTDDAEGILRIRQMPDFPDDPASIARFMAAMTAIFP